MKNPQVITIFMVQQPSPVMVVLALGAQPCVASAHWLKRDRPAVICVVGSVGWACSERIWFFYSSQVRSVFSLFDNDQLTRTVLRASY